MKKNIFKFGGTVSILIALVLAIVVGLLCQDEAAVTFLTTYIKPFGTIFLNLLKFIVVPVVFFSMVCGIISLKDIKKVGKIGLATVAYYLLTTVFAVTIGIIGALAIKDLLPVLETKGLTYDSSSTTNFMDTLVGIFPSNIIAPFSGSTMLQIIFCAIFTGVCILLIKEKGEPVAHFMESANTLFMKGVEIILLLSPIGVFCLLAPVVAANGSAVLGSLGLVIALAYVLYIIHMVIVYSASVGLLGNTSPLKFFKEMSPAMIFAFSSASSVGTLPISMECTKKLGVREDIRSFVQPLGATINMDGTAIFQGVCTIFIARCFGVDLSVVEIITVILTATLASIGTAGVPGAGTIMLSMVLVSVGLPIEGIALVAGVDRIFDMGRTVVNITGDAACSLVINNLFKENVSGE